MELFASTRRKALFGLFRIRHQLRAGGHLTLSELRCAWSRTGLRQDDLRLALAEMKAGRLLRERRDVSDRVYQLTRAAEQEWARWDEDLVEQVRDWVTLWRAEHRQRHGAAGAGRRRRAHDL